MPNLFSPHANHYARLSIGVLGLLVVATFTAGITLTRSPNNTRVGVPLDQPVPFSHQHHAFELGIDCRYCHTSVEKGPMAGVPPTETCMSCHSQIWTNSPLLEPVRESWRTGRPIKWNLLNAVPEFVYFNHSIHIERGINCNTCHGAVQNMHLTWKGQSFTMAWCLKCHREPEKYLLSDKHNPGREPRQRVFDLYWKYQANAPLTQVERDLLYGDGLVPNRDLEEGRKVVRQYGIQVRQLEDCWVCHR